MKSEHKHGKVTGTDGADQLTGSPGDDIIRGLDGADVIVGKGGDDVLSGGGDSDAVIGNSGDDIINGGGAVDILVGLHGEDTIHGGGGGDVLFGGQNDDTLSGDQGDDVFVYARPGLFANGHDEVADFTPGHDKIGLGQFGSKFDPLQHMRDTADGVVLHLGGGNTVTFDGLHASDFQESDFLDFALPV